MFDRILDHRILNAAAGRLGPGRTVQFAGVWGSSSALIAAAMGRLTGKAVLLVVGHLDQADEIADDIEVLTGKAAELFPAREVEIAKGDKRGQAPFSNDNDEKGASPHFGHRRFFTSPITAAIAIDASTGIATRPMAVYLVAQAPPIIRPMQRAGRQEAVELGAVATGCVAVVVGPGAVAMGCRSDAGHSLSQSNAIVR